MWDTFFFSLPGAFFPVISDFIFHLYEAICLSNYLEYFIYFRAYMGHFFIFSYIVRQNTVFDVITYINELHHINV